MLQKNFLFFFLEYSKNISSISSFVIKNDDVISAIIIILWQYQNDENVVK